MFFCVEYTDDRIVYRMLWISTWTWTWIFIARFVPHFEGCNSKLTPPACLIAPFVVVFLVVVVVPTRQLPKTLRATSLERKETRPSERSHIGHAIGIHGGTRVRKEKRKIHSNNRHVRSSISGATVYESRVTGPQIRTDHWCRFLHTIELQRRGKSRCEAASWTGTRVHSNPR